MSGFDWYETWDALLRQELLILMLACDYKSHATRDENKAHRQPKRILIIHTTFGGQ